MHEGKSYQLAALAMGMTAGVTVAALLPNLNWLLVSQFWHYVKQIVSHEGHTHSLLAAVCLSLAVAWVAYLTAGVPAIIPAFIASSVGYVLHLLLDDLTRIDLMPRRVAKTALSTLGQGHSQELYSIVAIGALSGIAMWLL